MLSIRIARNSIIPSTDRFALGVIGKGLYSSQSRYWSCDIIWNTSFSIFDMGGELKLFKEDIYVRVNYGVLGNHMIGAMLSRVNQFLETMLCNSYIPNMNPIKAQTLHSRWGTGHCSTALTLPESIFRPFRVTSIPRYLVVVLWNLHFSGLTSRSAYWRKLRIWQTC
jgi:hypothetical protein